MNKKYIGVGAILVLVMAVMFAVKPAFAATNSPQGGVGGWSGHSMTGQRRGMMPPGVAGQVASINGSILTVTSRGFGRGVNTTATTTYTVDATNATVMKNNATSTVASITVGDFVSVKGTVSGTNITATMIRDGAMRTGQPGAATATFQGNGEPIVTGTVASVNGSSLTVTNSGNITYTIDVSNATVQKPGVSNATVSSIVAGDRVIVQGTVNGTAVTATSVVDQPQAPAQGQNHPGFFGMMGQFFSRLFRF